jgi:subtilase family serine protease
VALGVPADGKRDVPDVSLTSASHDGYLIFQGGSLYSVGGTSAASPSFAGLMALVNQKTSASQGNANAMFYPLANNQYSSCAPVVFHDTTVSNNTVPGVTGFNAVTGYDQATGLGSVDANALVNNWVATPTFYLCAAPTAVSVAQGGTGASTITTSVSGGFNAGITLSTSGLPAGVTAGFSPNPIAAPGAGTSTLTLTVAGDAAAGTYPITVTGSGGGVTRTATVNLTVTSGQQQPFAIGFDMRATQAYVTDLAPNTYVLGRARCIRPLGAGPPSVGPEPSPVRATAARRWTHGWPASTSWPTM